MIPKGFKHSKKTRKQMSKTHMGMPGTTTGWKLPESQKEKIRKNSWMKKNKGKKSPFWKGFKAGYNAKHRFMRLKYGKAYKCENRKCIGKSKEFEWSKIRGRKYTRNIKDYKMLCKSCHRQYDRLTMIKGLKKIWKLKKQVMKQE